MRFRPRRILGHVNELADQDGLEPVFLAMGITGTDTHETIALANLLVWVMLIMVY